MALHNAFEGLATESKQTDLNALINSLLTAANAIQVAAEALNSKTSTVNTDPLSKENTQLELLTEVVYLLTDLVNNIPRIDTNKRLMVSHAESNPTVSIAASQTLGTIQNLGTASRPADAIPHGVSYIASTSIYDRITVS